MDRQVVLNPPVANFKLVDRPIDHPWRARMLINVVTFAKRWRVDAPLSGIHQRSVGGRDKLHLVKGGHCVSMKTVATHSVLAALKRCMDYPCVRQSILKQ